MGTNTGAQDNAGLLPNEFSMGCYGLRSDVKDTTGAGDCFRGSYCAARYGEGKSVVEAMRWAAAASSLACEKEGAMPSMPSRDAIARRSKQAIVGCVGAYG